MSLASTVKGARRPAQRITWADDDGNPMDLTGATLTGTILNTANKQERAIEGSLVPTDEVNGVFTWNYGTTDVATAGTYLVRFTATYPSGASPAKTIGDIWEVI